MISSEKLDKLFMLLRSTPEAERFSIKKKKRWMEIFNISSEKFDSLLKDNYFK